MADFNQALEHLLELEGYPGYVDIHGDSGGETVAGISRNNWSHWAGWQLVDTFKLSVNFKQRLNDSAQLRRMVAAFYQANFWTVWMQTIDDQQLAQWLFQMGVVSGLSQSAKLLQRAVGVEADGRFGLKSRAALLAADPVAVLAECRDLAQHFYRDLADRNPQDRQFLAGWLNRANA